MGAELSYRPHDAVAMSSCFGVGGPADVNTNYQAGGGDCQAWRDNKKYQFDINAQLNMTRTSQRLIDLIDADLGVFTAELTWVRYPGIDANNQYTRSAGAQKFYQLVAAGYGTWLDKSTPGYPIATGKGTANSVGLTVDFNVTYDGTVIPGWQLTPGVTFYDAVKGNTPTFSANYEQGARSAYAYLLINKNPQVWQIGISYVAYFGGNALTQPYSDRNALGAFVTRNF